MAKSMESDDEDVWLSTSVSPLRDLELELRCPICKEFMTNPVSLLPCHHTFCSACIRRFHAAKLMSIKRRATCAACNVLNDTQNDRCYLPNRSVERLVHQFRNRVRGPLLNVLQKSDGGDTKADSTEPAQESTDAAETQTTAPRSSRRNKSLTAEASSVSQRSTTTSPSNSRPKKRTKPHYTSKSKAQLRQLCRDDGLSDSGTEAELKARHAEFLVLYNSECDSAQPRSAATLAQMVHESEAARRAQAAQPQWDIQKLKGSEAELQSGFQKMIRALREQKKNKMREEEKETLKETQKETGEEEQPISSKEVRPTESPEKKPDHRTATSESPPMIKKRKSPETGLGRSLTRVQSAATNTQSPSIAIRSQPHVETTPIGENVQNKEPNATPRGDHPQCQSKDPAVDTVQQATSPLLQQQGQPKKKRTTAVLNDYFPSATRESCTVSVWACTRCTYHNAPRQKQCAICQQSRPPASTESAIVRIDDV